MRFLVGLALGLALGAAIGILLAQEQRAAQPPATLPFEPAPVSEYGSQAEEGGAGWTRTAASGWS